MHPINFFNGLFWQYKELSNESMKMQQKHQTYIYIYIIEEI